MQAIDVRSTRRGALVAAGAILAVLAMPGAALADPPSPGSAIKGAKNTTAAEVQGLMGGTQGERVLVIDARRPGSWEKGHLARAIKLNWRYSNITHSWSFDAKALGNDKAAPVVVYGQNESDGFAGLVVQKAIAEGFTNVLWLRGGFAEWVAASLPVTS
jgi:rhodanese-related sulfurtransferase